MFPDLSRVFDDGRPVILIGFSDEGRPHAFYRGTMQQHYVDIATMLLQRQVLDSVVAYALQRQPNHPHSLKMNDDDYFAMMRQGLRMMAASPEGKAMGMDLGDLAAGEDEGKG